MSATIIAPPPHPSKSIEGTSYVFVYADGTDTENAQELVDAYNEAKTKVQITQMPGDNLINTMFFNSPQSIKNGYNSWYYWTNLPNLIPLGVQNVEVVSNEFTGTIEIDVTGSSNYKLEFNYSGKQLTNVTLFQPFIAEIKRAVVFVTPKYYNFESDFVMDEEYVDLVSLDGSRSIVFNGAGTISITANDVFVKGIDVLDKSFTIGDDLNLLKVENCAGGDNSFSGLTITSGTFTNCQAKNTSFGGNGTVSGTFKDCQAKNTSFGGSSGIASGIFENCKSIDDDMNDSFFGSIASGTFTNCQGAFASFGRFTASGIFTNCTGIKHSHGGYSGGGLFGWFGTASGTFKDCKGSQFSFGRNASGTFINCESVGGNSGDRQEVFGSGFNGSATGNFINCIGGTRSFGWRNPTSGTFTNCRAGQESFGFNGGTLTGKLYYCRLTSGTFPTVSSGGITRLCIDGNNKENNQG